MLFERGSSSKGFSTARYFALVGPVTRMGATMTGQGARVAKGLAANFALVGFFSSMYTNVNGQSRALNKALATNVAAVGSFTSMYLFVAAQVRFTSKQLAAVKTFKLFHLFACRGPE